MHVFITRIGDTLQERITKMKARMDVLMVPKQTEEENVLRCKSCNSQVFEGDRFCPQCRAPLSAEAERELKLAEDLRIHASMSVLCDT